MTAVWLMTVILPALEFQAQVVIVIIVASAAAARDFGFARFRLPQNDRQVPETVFANGPAKAALQFGFELGTGVRTKVTTSSPYLVVATVLVISPSLLACLSCGLGFGLGRAAMIYQRYLSQDELEWDRQLDGFAKWNARSCSVLASGLAVALVFIESG
jgi:hypothetical protein